MLPERVLSPWERGEPGCSLGSLSNRTHGLEGHTRYASTHASTHSHACKRVIGSYRLLAPLPFFFSFALAWVLGYLTEA